MAEYNCKKRAERIKHEIEMGIISPFMIEEIVRLDSSIPEFAKDRVIKLAKAE